MQRHPPHVGTIGDVIASKHRMTIYCDKRNDGAVCGHNVRVDLEALATKYGNGFPVAEFIAMSRCTKCGAKWPDLSIRIAPIHTGGLGASR